MHLKFSIDFVFFGSRLSCLFAPHAFPSLAPPRVTSPHQVPHHKRQNTLYVLAQVHGSKAAASLPR